MVHFSPHWGPKYPNGFQLRLYVHTSVRLSVSLSGCLCRFLEIISAAHNCAYCMQPQNTGSNTLSGIIICLPILMSVRTLVREPFSIFVFVLIFSVEVQSHDSFIPTLGSEGPQWGPVENIFCPVCLSVSLYLCISVSIYLCISVPLSA